MAVAVSDISRCDRSTLISQADINRVMQTIHKVPAEMRSSVTCGAKSTQFGARTCRSCLDIYNARA